MASVTFDNATRLYPGGTRPAVDKLNLEVADGEFLVLVGPSGCGKSTSLRMLAGLEEVNSGRILIGDRDVTDVPPKDRDIAMVFQNYALYPHMTVAENMGFALKIAGVGKEERAARVLEAAKLLDLEEYLTRKPKALSGGQRQRVAMGRAIVRQPQVFLMDEPLSNLDAKLRVQLREQLKQLQSEVGVTTVYVTHDQDEALAMSDRIAVMNAGRIEQIGTPEEVYAHSTTEFVCTFIGEANRLRPELVAHLRDVGARQLDPTAASYLRLEKPTILSLDETAACPVVEGTVAARVYHGTDSAYGVDCGEFGRIRAIVREDGAPGHEPGTRVRLALPSDHILQYPASDIAA